MKYTDNAPPIVCMQTQRTCYKGTKKMTVRGVLWHSTGANNPKLSRYVQPSDNAPDREEMLALLGKNKYSNDINHIERQMGMNAWIGKLADGSVTTVQTMPWDYKPWGCGSGKNGSCNDGWIQFEICEDALIDETYARAAYREACELTAYLCRMFGIDPNGTVSFKGQTVPTILCHRDSHLLGLGNNHGDIYNWFPRYSLDMSTARADVAALMGGAPVRVLKYGSTGDDVKALQERLIELGFGQLLGRWGADGDFGAATESAVEAFQDSRGLKPDGIVGPDTLALLYDNAPPDVYKTYTITIHGVPQAEMEATVARWPDAVVVPE